MLYLILQRLKGQLGHPLLPTRNILEHVTFTSRLYFINLRKHLIKGKRIVLVGCSSWWIELFGVMKLIYYSALQCETLLGCLKQQNQREEIWQNSPERLLS